jgi:hypothetical protein
MRSRQSEFHYWCPRLCDSMKANNARLFHDQEIQRRRSVGDLEYGLNTRTEPSSNHCGITGVAQPGSSRAVHDSPQMPPPAYVRNSKWASKTTRCADLQVGVQRRLGDPARAHNLAILHRAAQARQGSAPDTKRRDLWFRMSQHSRVCLWMFHGPKEMSHQHTVRSYRGERLSWRNDKAGVQGRRCILL